MDAEPVIVINGTRLSEAQAMTVRVAIANLLTEMQDPDALGTDDLGRTIAAHYRARGTEVQDLMVRGPSGT